MKEEPREIISDPKVIISAVICTIMVLLYLMVNSGMFKDCSTDPNDFIELARVLLFLGITVGAPVWITCLIYLIYSVFRFLFAVGEVARIKPSKYEVDKKLREMTKKDLVDTLSKGD